MDTKEKIPVDNQTIIEDAESIRSDATTSPSEEKGNSLHRGLKARHIQMIALGGTIGKFR
jgi:amino acid permease